MDEKNESKLRKYGLEFIKDMAKDRKIAIQTLGVSISGFKNEDPQRFSRHRLCGRKIRVRPGFLH